METTAVTTKTKWVIDPAHSELLFSVKHLMITNVRGEFKKFQAEINTNGADFSSAEIRVRIEAASIFTNDDSRDQHLKGPDFFEIEKYPELTFEGTSFTRLDAEHYQLKGILNIKGTDKEVTLDVEFGGINKDPWGNEKAGFSLSGKINRKDWGLNWNTALETGGVLVSDEVKISAEVQLIKQA